MIRWNDVDLKYSLLLAGESLDIERIESCLKDGIKVLWFGEKADRDILISLFPEYIKAFFLCIYQNPNDVRLTVIDGIGIKDDLAELESLENGDSSFNLKQYEIEHDGSTPLVIVQAGAGSGKTFVMNNRLLYLLHMYTDVK